MCLSRSLPSIRITPIFSFQTSHNFYRIFGLHQSFLFRLRDGTTRAYQVNLLSNLPALQYLSSAKKTTAFDYASEADYQVPVPIALN